MKNLICIAFLIGSSFRGIAQWVHMNPGTTNPIYDISFLTDQIGYAAVENSGAIWKTTDGASSWLPVYNSVNIWRIVFLTEDTGLALSSTIGLIKTNDGGLTWNPVAVPLNAGWWSRPVFFNLHSGISIQQNATSDSMIVMKTSDGGDSWHTIMQRQDSLGSFINDISFPDSMTGYLVSETSMEKTTDGGYTWQLLQYRYPGFGSVSFISPDTGFCYVDLGQFFRTYDGGMTWDSFPLPSSPYNGQVRFLNSSIGFICGGNGFSSGFVMKTANGGANWTLDYGDNNTYFAFSFPGNNIGYACGDGGSVIKKSIVDGLYSWKNESSNSIFIANNPIHSHLKFYSPLFANDKIKLQIFNPIGEIVFEKPVATANEDLELTGLKSGLYFLSLNSSNSSVTTRFVKVD